MLPFRLARLLLAFVFAFSSLPLSVMLPPGAISTPHPVEAADPDGTLDPTFGSGGKVTTDFFGNGSHDVARALALQPDGKLVTAGFTLSGGERNFAVVRYTASGTLDPTFGSGGKVTTDFFGLGDTAYALALQPDGKIVVAGSAQNDNINVLDFAVVRYTASGALDPTFGSGGKVTTDFSGASDTANALALQPDGKLVVAGSAYNSSFQDFAVARYTSSGVLDPTFGIGGKATTDLLGSHDFANALALQPDGKIVVAGGALNSGEYDFALVRYTASGILDSTFGTGGKVTTEFLGLGDSAYSLALQPDGKIVAAGYTRSGFDIALVRYMATGGLDPTFGSSGKVTTNLFGTKDSALALALQPDGKILTVGYTENGSGSDWAVVRYTASGALDPTFGSGGKVTTDFFGATDTAYALGLQPDGKLVVAGYAVNGSSDDFAVARYLAFTPSALQFSTPSYTVVENGGSATITVTRSAGNTGAVSVTAATITGGGAATASTDYTHTSARLFWADGDTAPETFTVPITNDALIEPDETIALFLSSPTGGAMLGTVNTATLTITNDDAPVLGPYGNAVAADSPRGHWQLNEASGTLAEDSSGVGNHGTFMNGVTLNAAGALAAEAGNTAVTLDGVNDFVRVPDSASLSPTVAVSVETWVKLDAYSGSYPRLLSKPGAFELTMYTNVGHEGRLEWKVSLVSGDVLLATAYANRLLLGQWYHVVATYDGATMRVFINGQQRASKAATGAIKDSNAALTIGMNAPTRFPAASFDEAAVYGTALTAARVLAHYEAAVPPVLDSPYVLAVKADTPAAYWRLNEASGTQAGDRSGNSNTGTYTNGVVQGVTGALTSESDAAAQFDGVNDFVRVPDAPGLSPTAAVSVETWVDLTAYSGSYPRLLSKPGSYELTMYTMAGHQGRLEWKVSLAGGDVLVNTVVADRLLLGQWYHVAATYDGASLRVFINGVQKAVKAATGTVKDGTSAFTVSRLDRPIAAKLDEVAVYGAALSQARIAAHYTAR